MVKDSREHWLQKMCQKLLNITHGTCITAKRFQNPSQDTRFLVKDVKTLTIVKHAKSYYKSKDLKTKMPKAISTCMGFTTAPLFPLPFITYVNFYNSPTWTWNVSTSCIASSTWYWTASFPWTSSLTWACTPCCTWTLIGGSTSTWA